MADRFKLFAPYGGITRFRFKGSFDSERKLQTRATSEPLSQWLPRYDAQRNGEI